MPRFLLISHDGSGLPLAYRLHQDGHRVVAWIEDPTSKHLYDGLVKKVKTYKEGLDGDPILLFDTVGIGVDPDDRPETPSQWASYDPLSEQLRRKGYRVIGASKLADRMEFDRTWGAELAKEAGILLPETHRFDDFDKAIAFVQETKQRYIMKPHGNQAVFSNYPAEGWEDMVAMLEHAKEKQEGQPVPMELQEWISGQQMSIEGWWTGTEFVSHNSTFEFKPLMHNNIGPYTGECGSVVFYYPISKTPTKMEEEVLLKLVPTLKRLRYPPGPLDVNTILNEDGAHFLEFTARFGYPAIYIQLSAITSNLGEDLEALEAGTFEGFTIAEAKWFMGCRVVIPEWPYGHTQEALKDGPFFGKITEKEMASIHLVDAYFDDERLRAGGTDGELMCVTSNGQTIREAQAKLYEIINRIKLYPMLWRDDIGEHLQLEDLTRWGYWLPNET